MKDVRLSDMLGVLGEIEDERGMGRIEPGTRVVIECHENEDGSWWEWHALPDPLNPTLRMVFSYPVEFATGQWRQNENEAATEAAAYVPE